VLVENNMVARAIHGMIALGGRSEEVSLVSPRRDSTLADPQQVIADIRRELDECRAERDNAQRKLEERTAERDEAVVQQAAMAEILQIINSSPGDLAPVFDAILAKAVRLSESAFGMLLTWDGERFHRVAWQGLSAEQIEATRQPVSPAPPPGAPGYRIAQGEDVVCIADLAEEVMGGRVPPIQTLVRLGGRSYKPGRCFHFWPNLRDWRGKSARHPSSLRGKCWAMSCAARTYFSLR
jgi:hypothetical protein